MASSVENKKPAMKHALLITFLKIIVVVSGANYKFLKIDKFVGSPEINITSYAFTSSRINVTYDVPQPLNNFFVTRI